jgi:hypothetical protein
MAWKGDIPKSNAGDLTVGELDSGL